MEIAVQHAPGGLRGGKISKQPACPIQRCDRNRRVTRPAVPFEPASPVFDQRKTAGRRFATMQGADDSAESDRGLVVGALENQLRQGMTGSGALQQQRATRTSLKNPDGSLSLEMQERRTCRCFITLVIGQL